MKMADGGWRPAYNAQFVTDTASQVIVGLDLTNAGTDHDQLGPMVRQLRTRYGAPPGAWFADAGFSSNADIDELGAPACGTTLYLPPRTPLCPSRNPYRPLPDDTPALAAWRTRMGTPQPGRSTRIEPPPPSASMRSPAIVACNGLESGQARRPGTCSSGSLWPTTS